jgi:hypothetical protein
VKVWCDPHPASEHFKTYFESLKKIFPEVIVTSSLSDGYHRAISSSKADFCFILEHDWIFISENVNHNLEEICLQMKINGINHLRFNKRSNIIAGWDRNLEEVCNNGFEFCKTTCVSNNPHILNRKFFQDFILDKISIVPGSRGIEDVLSRSPLCDIIKPAIYGSAEHPGTVSHLNGRLFRARGAL